jgi:hypothetical protein
MNAYSVAKKNNTTELFFLDNEINKRPKMRSYPIFADCKYISYYPPHILIKEPSFTYNNINLNNNFSLNNNSFNYNSFNNTSYLLDGYFQSYKYSNDYLQEIKSLLLNKIPNINNKINDFYIHNLYDSDNISSYSSPRESIALHVRRTDYLQFSHFHSNLTDNYYKHALDTMVAELTKQNETSSEFPLKYTLYIFSDDIEFVKSWDFLDYARNIKISHSSKELDSSKEHSHNIDIVIVTLDDTLETWLLMTKCDHFIIANSSFSLSAYLFRDHYNAKLCIPKRWFEAAGPQYKHEDLVPLTSNVFIISD